MAATRPIFCPACGRKLLIPDGTPAGRKARCGACGTLFAIPEALAPDVLERILQHSSGARPRQGHERRAEPAVLRPQDVPAPQARRPAAGRAAPRRQRPPTACGQFNIGDLPADLREAMGADAGESTEPTLDAVRITHAGKVDSEEASRRAFDLDARNNPLRRTGAGAINIKDLKLLFEEDEKE